MFIRACCGSAGCPTLDFPTPPLGLTEPDGTHMETTADRRPACLGLVTHAARSASYRYLQSWRRTPSGAPKQGSDASQFMWPMGLPRAIIRMNHRGARLDFRI